MNEVKRFNLLCDSWIPVKTKYGELKTIKASEVVQQEIIAIDAPRADFNAALMQFLIGLLQTVYAPESPRAWRSLYAQPPSEKELQEKFKDIQNAFYLDGDDRRFMQDSSIKGNGNKTNILKLIPGIVGENTIDKNQDFFIKSSQISGMSLPNVILGLYLYQNYCLSETGGKNGRHHGSRRGRNTMTVLITKEDGSLWENLWLNVIQKKTYKTIIKSGIVNSHFEWMNDKPNEKEKSDNDLNLNDIYWSMPRRVWINFSELKDGICDLTAKKTKIVQNIYIKENGIEYKAKLSQHPLIAYSKDTDGLHAIKIGPEGVNYGDWLSFIGSETASLNLLEHINRRSLESIFKIFVCGYLNHPQQAKTLCWYQTKMPIYPLESEEHRKSLEIEINKYIQAANKISNPRSGYLSIAIRMAWFGYDYDEEKSKNKNKKPDPFYNKASKALYDHPNEIAKSFWNNTERRFYESIQRLYDCLNKSTLNDEKKVGLRHEWYKFIRDEAIRLFNRWAFRSGIQNNPKCIAKAYNQLMRNLDSNALNQDVLGLR